MVKQSLVLLNLISTCALLTWTSRRGIGLTPPGSLDGGGGEERGGGGEEGRGGEIVTARSLMDTPKQINFSIYIYTAKPLIKDTPN